MNKKKPPQRFLVSLDYRAPLNWSALLDFHRYHLIEPLEQIVDKTYLRIFKIGREVGAFRLCPRDHASLRLEVFTRSKVLVPEIVAKVRLMFDLDFAPTALTRSFSKFKILRDSVLKYPGLRVASGWDPFEVVICTILGQLVSTAQSRRLVHALVREHGRSGRHPLTGEAIFFFPTAKVLACADLKQVPTTEKRRKTINTVAALVAAGGLPLDNSLSNAAFRAKLLAIAGIGPWSADYIELRGLRRRDAFPTTDLILKRALARHPELNLEKIAPFKAYAAIYLWREYALSLSKAKTKRL